MERAAREIDENWKCCLRVSGTNAVPTDTLAILTRHAPNAAEGELEELRKLYAQAREACRLSLHALGNHHGEGTTGMRAYNAIRNLPTFQRGPSTQRPPQPARGSAAKEDKP